MLLSSHPSGAVSVIKQLTVVSIMTIATIAVARPVMAQDDVIDLPPGMKATDLKAPLLDRSHATLAHRYVERWVEAASVDDTSLEASARPRPIKVTGLWGAKVTLRWAGNMNVLGKADIYGSALKIDENGVVDLATIVRDLTAQALKDVEANVAERLKQARFEAAQRDEELSEDIKAIFTFERIARQLLVDVQLAHSPQRIRIGEQEPEDEIEYRICSGYHGLLMTHKADAGAVQRVGIVWPADAIARNFAIDTQLRSLLSQVQLPIGVLPDIARNKGPDLFRFRVMHVVRPKGLAAVGGQQPVTLLTRGHLILPPNMDVATLDAMAARIVDHLAQRIDRAPPLMGTFLPTTDDYKDLAKANEAALLTYALARRAAVLSAEGEDGVELQKTQALTKQSYDLMIELFKQQPRAGLITGSEMNPPPLAAAFAIMAILEAPNLAIEKETRDDLAAHLMRLQDASGHTKSRFDADAQFLNTTNQAVVCAALAQLYEQTRSPLIGDAANRARQAAWREFIINRQTVSSLPWMMRAETWLATFEDPLEQPDAKPGPLPTIKRKERIKKLGRYVRYFYDKQIIAPPDPALAPADVVGGFDLDGVDTANAVPMANIYSGPAMICMTIAINEPMFSSNNEAFNNVANRDELIVRCSLAARFFAQLMVDEPGAYYVADPADIIGGVRPTPAENDLTIDASATALIAASELKAVLLKLEKKE